LVISNNQPCIGETIIISSNNKGDWYLNNKLIDENTDNIEHTINLDKSLLIAFKNEFGEEQEIINVINSEYQIITKKIDLNTFAFTLSNQEINVNWYLDDSLVAENENTCKITEYRVGEHEIKSVPANSKCISKSSTIFNIGSIGSIKFFNVFTPNGDGTNDEYSVEINNYENYRIIIYDQVKNQIIFTSNTPDNRWNGSINNTGQDCPPGEYLAKINYTLKGEKPQTKNIKFTLIRP
jgi:gliding motility-associated-like protein